MVPVYVPLKSYGKTIYSPYVVVLNIDINAPDGGGVGNGVLVGVIVGNGVLVGVFVGNGVLVGVFVGGGVGGGVGVLVGVSVGVLVGGFVGNGVKVGVTVGVTVLVGVIVGSGVLVGVFVGGSVGGGVGVFVGVSVLVGVTVFVGVTAPSIAKVNFFEEQVTGSNGFAIAPSKTESGNAILYINPHVTFYFRPEVQVVSEEVLNVYGAVTWGQFFVYQGFNEYCGWMHTSSNVDVADLYIEKIVKKDNKLFYEYDNKLKPVIQKSITLRYKKDDSLLTKTITAYYTHHGPIMAKRDGNWISVRGYNRSLTSLIQSFQRTKAKGLEDYKKNMSLYANTSNNTVFADNKGNIAYWHGDYVPRRDSKLNWSKPVDGTTSATEWKGLHSLDEIVHVYNPATGWIQNCNSTPFTVSGISSPKKENYPTYMAPDGENFRGINAARVLSSENKFTIDKTIAAGYDRKLSAFEVLVPALINSFEKNISPTDTLYSLLIEPIEILKKWNYYSEENSIATTLAVEWAQKITTSIQRIYIDEGWDDQVTLVKKFAATASAEELMQPLLAVVNDLKRKFGTWEIAWGDINRYQRISGDMTQKYRDDQPSFPVGFASASWGMLPSYNSRYFSGTNKRYGVSGNSFICAVEFGKKIKAKSLLAGGNSGNSTSKHFTDQLEMYTNGKFKEVLFYKEDVLKNAERTYHPGE